MKDSTLELPDHLEECSGEGHDVVVGEVQAHQHLQSAQGTLVDLDG